MTGHLVDRHPTASPERLIAQLSPPPTFAAVSFESYRPDPGEPTQSAALASCQGFCDAAVRQRAGRRKMFGGRETLPGIGLYLDGGFGVGKTHLLASIYHRLPDANPRAFATFGELTQLAGVFGFAECIDLLSDYTAVCIDEFELDDPGDTMVMTRLLGELVATGTRLAATSNTPPNALGEGRFAAQDFLREIHAMAESFQTIRIDGTDYRHRDVDGHAISLDSADYESAIESASAGAIVSDDAFEDVVAQLARVHPSRYIRLIEGVSLVGLREVSVFTDQSAALRFVALVDRIYDAQIPIRATGLTLDTVFPEEMLAGGYRKKYLRAISRLVASTLA